MSSSNDNSTKKKSLEKSLEKTKDEKIDVEKGNLKKKKSVEKDYVPLEIKNIRKSIKMSNLVKYDKYFNEEMTSLEKKKGIIFFVVWSILFSGLLVGLFYTLPSEGDCSLTPEELCRRGLPTLFNLLLLFAFLLVPSILSGILAVKLELKIGYSRKIIHFVSFFSPFIVNKAIEVQSNALLIILKFMIILVVYFFALKPIRRKIWPMMIIFRALDRPEDRPYTLEWFMTQFIVSAIVIVPFSILWENIKNGFTGDLVLILVIINGIGDGLAEPVGIKFGKHKYTTRALWYDGKFWSGSFTRSIEGSSMVYLVSLITILAFHYIFTIKQLVIGAIFIPIIMTLTEAFSPRTWDSPFLFLIGGLSLTGMIYI